LKENLNKKKTNVINLNTPVEYNIALLCRIYPNDADLGAKIRKHFQKI